MEFIRRCWAEVNLDNVVLNYRTYAEKLSENGQIMAVVKANAYGHGANEISAALENAGCSFFAVSSLSESEGLREGGIKSDILLMGYTPVEHVHKLKELNIYQTIYSYEYAKMLNSAAKQNGQKIKVFLKADTGMGRLGFDAVDVNKAANEITKVFKLRSLIIEGIFTHFAAADDRTEKNIQYTNTQQSSFDCLLERLRQRGITFKYIFACNSAAGHYGYKQYSGIRAGIGLYGLNPSGKKIEGLDLRPVMTLKTMVNSVKKLPAGRDISYGRTYTCSKDTSVAVVSIGYADGYSRHLSNKGIMYVNGIYAPVIGRVCMDLTMLDVTKCNANIGDEVIVFGESGISAEETAELCGTICYELVCGISARVPRVFLQNGKIVSIKDTF